jgi:hypothetical protein
VQRPVGVEDREGVFVHAFKCRDCRLEFQLYSWKRDRHRVGEVYCPECGRATRMLHWRACVNPSRTPGGPESATEIYSLTTRFPGFELMADSAVD